MVGTSHLNVTTVQCSRDMKFDCEMPPIYEYKAEQCGPQTVLKKCKIDPREDGFLQHVLRLFIPTTDPTLGSFIEI